MSELYDQIGVGYADKRRPDARIAAAINAALGDARTVLNVGAGTGSYEPADRQVVAVEPSLTMIAQRRSPAPVVRAYANDLPFRDRDFDVASALLTLHHWPDRDAGLRELRRVARRVVLLTWEPDQGDFWLTQDYFPDIVTMDRRIFPTSEHMRDLLGDISVVAVPVPHDCHDGFLGAYWRRPEAYLDPDARAAISAFSKVDDVEERIERLRADLADGTWMRRHGDILQLQQCDLGYRLVISDLECGAPLRFG